jgi:hypothetical protein
MASNNLIKVYMNKWRNYVHEPTGFVFNRVTLDVYGVQGHDGNVIPLTHEDIRICKEMNLGYKLPANSDIVTRENVQGNTCSG